MMVAATTVRSVILLAFLVTVSHSKELVAGVDKCSFNSANYSLRWRYEKATNNVIFFLKTSGDAEGKDFWSGVGFGDEKQNASADFVSVFVKKGQFGLADMHTGKKGQLFADTFTNVQVISFDVEKGKLSAQFSRSLAASDENDADLQGCTKFYFPLKPFNNKDTEKNTLKLADLETELICDIAKHCEIDDSGLLSGNSVAKNVEFAMSVDKSGTGDPCSFQGETYNVSWKYDKRTDNVNFDMSFPMKGGKWWSAVGLGDTMEDMDMVVFFLDNGVFKSHADYFSSGYTVPSKDDSQDWHAEKSDAKVVDGIVHLKFSRALETNDNENDRTLDGCVLFQFAANLGKYGSKFSIRKHEDWPDLYKACGLKEHCGTSGKRPRFAQARDEVVESIPSAEGSGEEAEHFTTTESTPAEMVDGAINALNASLEEDSLLTTGVASIVEISTVAPVVNVESEQPVQQPVEQPEQRPVQQQEQQQEQQTEQQPAQQPEQQPAQQQEQQTEQQPAQQPEQQQPQQQPEQQPVESQPEAQDPMPNPTTLLPPDQITTETPTTVELITEAPATVEVITEAPTIPVVATEASVTSEEPAIPESPAVPAVPETPAAPEAPQTEAPAVDNSVLQPAVVTEAPEVSTSEAATEATESTKPITQCEDNHEDLSVCKSYIDEYFGEVGEWARKHNETIEAQRWKACSLLQKVPHVPTLCCGSYLDACRNHLPAPQQHSGSV